MSGMWPKISEWVGPKCPKSLVQDVQSGPKRLCPKVSLAQDVRIPSPHANHASPRDSHWNGTFQYDVAGLSRYSAFAAQRDLIQQQTNIQH